MLWDEGPERPHPSSPKTAPFHWKTVELSLSGTVLGFVGNIKMSKTIIEPPGSSVLWGNPDRSTVITQAEEGSTHIECTRNVQRG